MPLLTHLSFSSSMAFLVMFVMVAFVSSLLASSAPEAGFKATLRHVDHARGLARDDLFQRAVQRSKIRVERRSLIDPKGLGRVHGNGGEYVMNLAIGTPKVAYHAVIDTDTDLIWTTCGPMLCGDEQKSCSEPQTVSGYDPAKSSSYAKVNCASDPCKSVAPNPSCNTKIDSCNYKYQYLDENPSWTQGDFAVETFGYYNGKGSTGNLLFGCARTTSGQFGSLGSGFVGLGRGPLSLVSQMNVTRFSHCFPSYDSPDNTGVVAFGSKVKIAPPTARGTATSDMLQSPLKKSSYYVSLQGIKVNNIPLLIETSAFKIDHSGKGGIVVDSGMTVSYLETSIYNKLTEKLDSLIKLEKVSGVDIGLDQCYKVPKEFDSALPTIAFTFGNGNTRSDLVFASGNVFRSYEDQEHGEVTCLAMAAAPVIDGSSSLGNMQLQGTLVVYDLAHKKVYFAPNAPCGKM